MAITTFTLARALTESANAAHTSIGAYDFGTDNLNECFADMNYRIMSEAADMNEIMVSTEELLAETSITNPSRVDILHENVFTSIKEGVIKFFNKIISMVKGIIEKIKEFFYKMTNKTDKWVSLMEPKITAAQKRTGHSDFTAECYNWNADIVTTTIKRGVQKLAEDWGTAAGHSDKVLSTMKDVMGRTGEQYKDKNADDEDVKKYVASLEERTKTFEADTEHHVKTFPNEVANAFGAKSNPSTIDVVWSDITNRAHGGTEKITRKISSEVNSMLAFVKESKNTIKDLKDTYETHIKQLSEMKTKIERASSDFTITDENKYPVEVTRAARDVFKAHADKLMKITTSYETAMNTARQININLVQAMTSDYMAVLSKFAGYKGKSA